MNAFLNVFMWSPWFPMATGFSVSLFISSFPPVIGRHMLTKSTDTCVLLFSTLDFKSALYRHTWHNLGAISYMMAMVDLLWNLSSHQSPLPVSTQAHLSQLLKPDNVCEVSQLGSGYAARGGGWRGVWGLLSLLSTYLSVTPAIRLHPVKLVKLHTTSTPFLSRRTAF